MSKRQYDRTVTVISEGSPEEIQALRSLIGKENYFAYFIHTIYEEGMVEGCTRHFSGGPHDDFKGGKGPALPGFDTECGRRYYAVLKKVGVTEEIDTFHSFFWSSYETKLTFAVSTEYVPRGGGGRYSSPRSGGGMLNGLGSFTGNPNIFN